MTEPVTQHTDVLIIGAGPVGMTLARALAESPLRRLIIGQQPRGAWASDPRALAIAHGSQLLLQRLKVWNNAANTAIHEIHVSQRGAFGRTLIKAEDYRIPALGHVIRYRDLAAALDTGIGSEQFLDRCTVDAIEPTSDAVSVTLNRAGTTQRITAKLVVHAEGAPTNGPGIQIHDYRQQAVIAEVRPTAPHGHRAWERFTADGPLALLPIGQDYAVVWAVPPEKAERLLALNDDAFLAALRAQFGTRLQFASTGARTSQPLALRIRQTIARQRQVWIGNAAQTLHPVAGQGFNLGLRDAWELADFLHRHRDPGTPSALSTYANARALDRRLHMILTDGLVRLFSNALPPLRIARGLGLLTLDLLPSLRHAIARQMIWGTRSAGRTTS